VSPGDSVMSHRCHIWPRAVAQCQRVCFLHNPAAVACAIVLWWSPTITATMALASGMSVYTVGAVTKQAHVGCF